MKIDPKRLRLYAVTDRAWTHDAEGLLRQVAAAVDGGAGIVQLREKHADPRLLLEEARQMAQRIMQKMKEPIELAGRRMVMTTSIGISLFPDDGSSCDELLKNADLALYQSKGSGRNKLNFFSDNLKTRAMGLNVAYTMGAFQPHFQYQHGWKNSTNVGDEAGTNFNQYVLGLNYLMSKRTMAHVAAGYVKSGDNEQGEAALKGTTYAVGLTHLF